jgi:hypothetical protein
VDAAARTVSCVPEGLPRTHLPLRHGAPAVALPLVVPLHHLHDAAAPPGAGAGGLLHAVVAGEGGEGGGGHHRLALATPLPADVELALDVLAEPAFTTCTQGFTEALDYVLVSPRVEGGAGRSVLVEVAGVLALPTMDDVTEGGAVVAAPSARHPSDHFPLVAELLLRIA